MSEARRELPDPAELIRVEMNKIDNYIIPNDYALVGGVLNTTTLSFTSWTQVPTSNVVFDPGVVLPVNFAPAEARPDLAGERRLDFD